MFCEIARSCWDSDRGVGGYPTPVGGIIEGARLEEREEDSEETIGDTAKGAERVASQRASNDDIDTAGATPSSRRSSSAKSS